LMVRNGDMSGETSAVEFVNLCNRLAFSFHTVPICKLPLLTDA
jgi:hypothetical protein